MDAKSDDERPLVSSDQLLEDPFLLAKGDACRIMAKPTIVNGIDATAKMADTLEESDAEDKGKANNMFDEWYYMSGGFIEETADTLLSGCTCTPEDKLNSMQVRLAENDPIAADVMNLNVNVASNGIPESQFGQDMSMFKEMCPNWEIAQSGNMEGLEKSRIDDMKEFVSDLLYKDLFALSSEEAVRQTLSEIQCVFSPVTQDILVPSDCSTVETISKPSDLISTNVNIDLLVDSSGNRYSFIKTEALSGGTADISERGESKTETNILQNYDIIFDSEKVLETRIDEVQEVVSDLLYQDLFVLSSEEAERQSLSDSQCVLSLEGQQSPRFDCSTVDYTITAALDFTSKNEIEHLVDSSETMYSSMQTDTESLSFSESTAEISERGGSKNETNTGQIYENICDSLNNYEARDGNGNTEFIAPTVELHCLEVNGNSPGTFVPPKDAISNNHSAEFTMCPKKSSLCTHVRSGICIDEENVVTDLIDLFSEFNNNGHKIILGHELLPENMGNLLLPPEPFEASTILGDISEIRDKECMEFENDVISSYILPMQPISGTDYEQFHIEEKQFEIVPSDVYEKMGLDWITGDETASDTFRSTDLLDVAKRKLSPVNVQKSESLTEFVRFSQSRSGIKTNSVKDYSPRLSVKKSDALTDLNSTKEVLDVDCTYEIKVENFIHNDSDLEDKYSALLGNTEEATSKIQCTPTERTLDEWNRNKSILKKTPAETYRIEKRSENKESIHANPWNVSDTGDKFKNINTAASNNNGIISRIRSWLYSLTAIFRRSNRR